MSSAEPHASAHGIEGVLITLDEHTRTATFLVESGVLTLDIPESLLSRVSSLRGAAIHLIVEDNVLRDIRPVERGSAWYFESIQELSAQQGTRPIGSVADLKADFWPEWQSVDDFIDAAKGRSER